MNKPLFDTSILIGGLIDLGEASRLSMHILDRVAEGACAEPVTAWHCCLEFYSVATRLPDPYRLRPADALILLRQEILGRMKILSLASGHRDAFLERAVADSVSGGRIYDAHIAEIALANGCTCVVTENRRHFQSLAQRGLPVLGAEAFLDNLG